MANRMQRDPRATGMLLGHAKVNLAPSQHHFELLTRHGFETLYVPNFLELNLYTYKLRKKATPNLLWVRSLHRIYQPLMAVRLLERLLQDYPQATLTMVGPDKDGSMAIIQKYVTEHQLTDQVRLTGLCTKSEWHALAASHDIFLNTTSIDNHPVSVIEAMALGLPVVSTNAGGLKQLLTHEVNALLSDPDQENDMLKHIYTILQNPDWCERLSNAGRTLVEDFDWEKIKRHYQEILGADNQSN